MATIYNSDVKKAMIEGAYLKVGSDSVPEQLGNQVIPVMETNPALLRRVNYIIGATTTANGNQILVTLDTTKDFYLTGYALSVLKDATSDATGSNNIWVTPDAMNAVGKLKSIPLLTTTAQSYDINVQLTYPIKLKRGSQIYNDVSAFTVGNCVRSFNIMGYYVENSNNN